MARARPARSATVRPHPLRLSRPEGNGDLWLCTVELRDSRVYSCPWRREVPPTEAEVLAAWREDRRAFTEGSGS